MNELIVKLASQAGFNIKRLMEPYPGGFPREDMLALESFAKLIIEEGLITLQQEKFRQADDADTPYDDGCVDGISRAEYILKKHFGVK